MLARCESALESTLKTGGRETKSSRMEVLSPLLNNPYHISLSHAISVYMLTYQMVSIVGSTAIEEFQTILAQEIGTRDATNGTVFPLTQSKRISNTMSIHWLNFATLFQNGKQPCMRRARERSRIHALSNSPTKIVSTGDTHSSSKRKRTF